MNCSRMERGPVLQGSKILVVDDEPDALTFLSTVLEDNGAEVLQATDGEQALEIARRERPDLITLDLSMPGKSGVVAFGELRKEDELNETPVCIITGRPEMRELIYQRTTRPPEGYLEKPVDENTLLRNVRKILRTRRQRPQND